jgi:hypothetical protein
MQNNTKQNPELRISKNKCKNCHNCTHEGSLRPTPIYIFKKRKNNYKQNFRTILYTPADVTLKLIRKYFTLLHLIITASHHIIQLLNFPLARDTSPPRIHFMSSFSHCVPSTKQRHLDTNCTAHTKIYKYLRE